MSKTVLITGSSRGIGKAIAQRLARDGYEIVVHCRSRREEADELAQSIATMGRHARVLQFDISDRATTAATLEADIERHGCYYGIVCNAGVVRDNVFPAMSGDDWDFVLRSNLDGFYNVLNPLIMPLVRRRAPGRIVTLASVSGLDRQSRSGQLQRREGGDHRCHQGTGVGTGEARNHGQLCRAGVDRDGTDRARRR